MRFSISTWFLILAPFAIRANPCTDLNTFKQNFPNHAPRVLKFLALSPDKQIKQILNQSENFINFYVSWPTKNNPNHPWAVLLTPKINPQEDLTSPENSSHIQSVIQAAEGLEDLSKLPGSKVMPLYACFEKDGKFYLLFEHIESGLWTSDASENKQLDNKSNYLAFRVRHSIYRLKLFLEMAKIIAFLHNNGYVHYDISPRIFSWDVDNKTIKLRDIGFLRKETQNLPLGGDPFYMDLERLMYNHSTNAEDRAQIASQGRTQEGDIWALAVTYYALDNDTEGSAFSFRDSLKEPATQAVRTRDNVLSADWINSREINLCTKNEEERVCFADILRGMMYVGHNDDRLTANQVVKKLEEILEDPIEVKIEGPVGLKIQEVEQSFGEHEIKYHII